MTVRTTVHVTPDDITHALDTTIVYTSGTDPYPTTTIRLAGETVFFTGMSPSEVAGCLEAIAQQIRVRGLEHDRNQGDDIWQTSRVDTEADYVQAD